MFLAIYSNCWVPESLGLIFSSPLSMIMLFNWNVFRFVCFCWYSISLSQSLLILFFWVYKACIAVLRVETIQKGHPFCPVPIPLFFPSCFHWVTNFFSFWFILPGFLYALRNRYTHAYFLISVYFLCKG